MKASNIVYVSSDNVMRHFADDGPQTVMVGNTVLVLAGLHWSGFVERGDYDHRLAGCDRLGRRRFVMWPTMLALLPRVFRGGALLMGRDGLLLSIYSSCRRWEMFDDAKSAPPVAKPPSSAGR